MARGADENHLEDELSEPTPELIRDIAALDGDLILLGAGGKMGPTLAMLAARAVRASGSRHRVIAVSRFQDAGVRARLSGHGVEVIAADLFDPGTFDTLPAVPNVISLVGRKFGTSGDAAATWATNVWIPALVLERFAQSRVVVLSTGNVYPLTASSGRGPAEDHSLAPIGEYAWSALARERMVEFLARRHDTRAAIVRLNYAVEPRYGILRDIADAIVARRPIALAMGAVNVIWQRDANAIVLRMLRHCATPPAILNVTGPVVRVRQLAMGIGQRLGVDPVFEGSEGETALLSNASRADQLFGAPPTGIDAMIDGVVAWMEAGGRSLSKPTHFGERSGAF